MIPLSRVYKTRASTTKLLTNINKKPSHFFMTGFIITLYLVESLHTTVMGERSCASPYNCAYNCMKLFHVTIYIKFCFFVYTNIQNIFKYF